MLVGGEGTILPCCGGSVVELISFADASPTGSVRTKPRCTLQAHDVAIEVAQHFEKIVVKSVKLHRMMLSYIGCNLA